MFSLHIYEKRSTDLMVQLYSRIRKSIVPYDQGRRHFGASGQVSGCWGTEYMDESYLSSTNHGSYSSRLLIREKWNLRNEKSETHLLKFVNVTAIFHFFLYDAYWNLQFDTRHLVSSYDSGWCKGNGPGWGLGYAVAPGGRLSWEFYFAGIDKVRLWENGDCRGHIGYESDTN